jgi:hypothetical protein
VSLFADAPVLAPAVLPGAAATESPPFPPPGHVGLRGSVLSRVLALAPARPAGARCRLHRASSLSRSTSLLQALEVLPLLKQVRLPSRVSLLRCVRRHAQASADVLPCVDTIARRDSLPPSLVCSLRRLDIWSEGFEGVCSCLLPSCIRPSRPCACLLCPACSPPHAGAGGAAGAGRSAGTSFWSLGLEQMCCGLPASALVTAPRFRRRLSGVAVPCSATPATSPGPAPARVLSAP